VRRPRRKPKCTPSFPDNLNFICRRRPFSRRQQNAPSGGRIQTNGINVTHTGHTKSWWGQRYLSIVKYGDANWSDGKHRLKGRGNIGKKKQKERGRKNRREWKLGLSLLQDWTIVKVREKEFKLRSGWNGQLTPVSCWWSEGSDHAVSQKVRRQVLVLRIHKSQLITTTSSRTSINSNHNNYLSTVIWTLQED
jgi:hypothetical protein